MQVELEKNIYIQTYGGNNHNGWSKMKKKNRRRFKKKFKDEDRKMINTFYQEGH